MSSTFSFQSSNGKNKIYGRYWMPDREPVAILQIAHGMTEHMGRYDDFGKFMAKNGILVVGNDHMGHGKSVSSQEEWGYFSKKNGSNHIVADVHTVTQLFKHKYPGIPFFLLGHSMGSYIVRKYLMTVNEQLDGAIIMGTGNQTLPLVLSGKYMVKLLSLIKGENYRSKFIQQLVFGSYNKKIQNLTSGYDWLTSDKGIINQYRNDPSCTFVFTLNGFLTLFEIIHDIKRKKNIEKIPKELSILLTSGTEDPVGNYGKDVNKVYQIYKDAGLKKIEIKLYKGYRHEILNETSREVVYQDLLNWILKNK